MFFFLFNLWVPLSNLVKFDIFKILNLISVFWKRDYFDPYLQKFNTK